MPDELSVRQWQDQFRAGAFERSDYATQCRAGWYDWFCQDHALAGRLKKIGRVVMGITNPFILDNYYVWFKNNCPLNGPLYDQCPLHALMRAVQGDHKIFPIPIPGQRLEADIVI